ncbi:MAG: DNA polymerase IV [Pseudomonadales bacterium]|jgi:DNA polymerase-4|nr:DNA polymerase IV [Pseudomonadales bacterium]
MLSKFIHCDCDCFFAAIEIRDDPALLGLPVAVGGEAARRGVIATCNYEARRYGVHSAMATATAQRLCRDLIVIPGNMEKYRLASRQILAIYADYTDLIEPLSLDEAYLDVTRSSACRGSATLIAKDIRARVKREVGITVSAGIAPNKFLAKIASDWRKPDGQFVITPNMVSDFVRALPVRKIHGVGKVTARKMHLMGIETCADLQKFSPTQLAEHFGGFGERLYQLCRGQDERPIQTEHIPKSISVEETYAQDLVSLDQCLAALPDLFAQLQRRMEKSRTPLDIAKLFVKLKFANFVTTTVEHSAFEPKLDGFAQLCATGFARGGLPVRLLGLGIRLREAPRFVQLELLF